MSDKLGGIITRIVKEDADDGFKDDELVVLLILKKILAQNEEKYENKKQFSADQENELISLAKKELRDTNSVNLNTLKMEVTFYSVSNKEQQQSNMKFSEKEVEARKALQELMDMKKKIKTGSQKTDDLYMPMLKYVFTNVAPQVDFSDMKVRDEVASAVESVVPRKDVSTLEAMDESALETQLVDLCEIVMGIRLFHKHSQLGSEDLLGYHLLCENDSQMIGEQLQTAITNTAKAVNALELSLIKSVNADPTVATSNITNNVAGGQEGASSSSSSSSSSSESLSPIALQKQELVNRHQLLMFLHILYSEIVEVAEFCSSSSAEFTNELAAVKEIVGGKSAVPKSQPRFVRLSRLWKSLYAAYDDIIAIRNTFIALLPFHCPREIEIEKELAEMTSSGEIVSEGEPFHLSLDEETMNALLDEEQKRLADGQKPLRLNETPFAVPTTATAPQVKLISPSSPTYDSLVLHFEGFCPCAFVAYDGLLVPGDLSLGVVQWTIKNITMNFAFSTQSALDAFMKNPSHFVDAVYMFARVTPEYAPILSLSGELHQYDVFQPRGQVLARAQAFAASTSTSSQPKMVDSDTQTPVHFMRSNIVPDYEWNEWALRRKALQLVKLKNKRTDATQTINSHFRREAETQAYEMRDNSTNTGHDSGDNTTKTIRYIKGLRGSLATKVSIVTYDLDEVREPYKSNYNKKGQ